MRSPFSGCAVALGAGVWLELARGRDALFNAPLPKLFLTAREGAIYPMGGPAVQQFVAPASPFPDSLTGPIDIGTGRHYAQEDQPERIAQEIEAWDVDTFG